jgi:hypothetical protein
MNENITKFLSALIVENFSADPAFENFLQNNPVV